MHASAHAHARQGVGHAPAGLPPLPGSLHAFWADRHARTLQRMQASNRALVHRPVDEVCVYWLTNMCVAGDRCRYLHLYVEDKLPKCKYITRKEACPDGVRCVYRPCCLGNL